MAKIILDASGWQTKTDFYDAVLAALGAPAWHGRNLDALRDSIVAGGINGIEPPYEIEIIGGRSDSADIRSLIESLREMVAEANSRLLHGRA